MRNMSIIMIKNMSMYTLWLLFYFIFYKVHHFWTNSSASTDVLSAFPSAVPSKLAILRSWCFILPLRVRRTWACESQKAVHSFKNIFDFFLWSFFCAKTFFLFRWLNKLGLASIQYEAPRQNAATGSHPPDLSPLFNYVLQQAWTTRTRSLMQFFFLPLWAKISPYHIFKNS